MKMFILSVLIAGVSASLTACSQAPPSDQSVRNGLNPASVPAAQQSAAEPIPNSLRTTLTGKIDRKYEIQMDLERDGDKIKGTYFYQRTGAMSVASKYIMLEGSIDSLGNVLLTETDFNAHSGKALKTGEFKGRLTSVMENDSSRLHFTGSWTRARDKKTMPFSLVEYVPNLGPSLTLTEEKKSDQNKAKHYDLETALPRLKGADTIRAAKFNQAVDRFVSAQITEFKGFAEEDAKSAATQPGRRASDMNNSLDIGHSVTSSSDKHISALFTYFSYTGGAHPNTNTASLNYDLEKGTPITLDSLFKPGSNYLKIISDYCIAELSKLKVGDADWIRRGAGPDAGNFKSWNITPQGLMITFDAYQVASYAEGPQEVVIPYSVLKNVINPGGLLSRY